MRDDARIRTRNVDRSTWTRWIRWSTMIGPPERAKRTEAWRSANGVSMVVVGGATCGNVGTMYLLHVVYVNVLYYRKINFFAFGHTAYLSQFYCIRTAKTKKRSVWRQPNFALSRANFLKSLEPSQNSNKSILLVMQVTNVHIPTKSIDRSFGRSFRYATFVYTIAKRDVLRRRQNRSFIRVVPVKSFTTIRAYCAAEYSLEF